MKKFGAFLVLLASFAVVGCGKPKEKPPVTPPAPAADADAGTTDSGEAADAGTDGAADAGTDSAEN